LVLAESRALGRTEQFVPVRLNSHLSPGEIAEVAIAGQNGQQLLAA
jgi:hypothetical protein